jgi:hypothetical protein
MKKHLLLAGSALLLAVLACGNATSLPAFQTAATPTTSIFDSGKTAFGFFPSPPEGTSESFIATIKTISEHGDVILLQQAIPWADFVDSSSGASQDIADLRNVLSLAQGYGLEAIFVIDPLNGLDRRRIAPLPAELEGGDFSTPEIRSAFMNYALRLVSEFQPRYLGLASEINTYADAHPEDFPNYVSLYREVYAAVKATSPQTQVFVTFQWDDLNNVIPFDTDTGEPYQTKWEQVEIFEPALDVWAISSYPFVAFENAADIPPDYYTPLLARTDKPLAVAEGGVNSRDIGQFHGAPQDQVEYLNAIDTQIGERLAFWIYLVIDDINAEFYRDHLAGEGLGESAEAILWFAAVGLRERDGAPKPGLETWDQLQGE